MAEGSVLVTGASTGIGEATALHLKELGFDSVAAVRREDDAQRLRRRGLRAVKLDVTDPGSIDAARKELGEEPLAGLVNNAGIAVAGPVEFLPLDHLRLQLEVNLVGQVAVTQAFLPALRRGHGRIVFTSSIGGRVALPLMSPYNASKFALEAMADSLRRELQGQGIHVILIEPGGVRTPIWRKGNEVADQLLERMPPEAEELYGDLIAGLRKQTQKIEQKTGIEPGAVAEYIGRALTARRPRTRYLVGTDAKVRAPMAGVLPDRVMDSMITRAIKGR
jgi:NAD(P)-dependent dehydrogenase (short-subunit alcohol dehydrogenase family)